MKLIFLILLIFFGICFTSAFWLDYFANQRKINIELSKQIEKMDAQICTQAREMNRLSKERNFWIMEANRLKRGLQ